MIDVGIAGDEHHVDAVPAPSLHLGAAGRQVRACRQTTTGKTGSIVGARLETGGEQGESNFIVA